MTEQRGLRERKKQDTREAIAETARRLFSEHGFDAVTVADVARAADVSRKTVFNYFPTKEDLVYWRLEGFEAALLAAVRDRAPGESYLGAFGRFVLAPRGLLAREDPEAIEALAALTRMVIEPEIAGTLQSEPDATKAAQKLVDLANDRGGSDNITVIVVRIGAESKGWFSWLRPGARKHAAGNGSAGGK